MVYKKQPRRRQGEPLARFTPSSDFILLDLPDEVISLIISKVANTRSLRSTCQQLHRMAREENGHSLSLTPAFRAARDESEILQKGFGFSTLLTIQLDQLTAAFVANLSVACPHLRTLKVLSVRQSSYSDGAVSCKSITQFEMYETCAVGVEHLVLWPFKSFPNLRVVRLSRSQAFGSPGLSISYTNQYWIYLPASVEELYCDIELDDTEHLYHFVMSVKSLRVLAVTNCARMKTPTVAYLIDGLMDHNAPLEYLEFSGRWPSVYGKENSYFLPHYLDTILRKFPNLHALYMPGFFAPQSLEPTESVNKLTKFDVVSLKRTDVVLSKLLPFITVLDLLSPFMGARGLRHVTTVKDIAHHETSDAESVLSTLFDWDEFINLTDLTIPIASSSTVLRVLERVPNLRSLQIGKLVAGEHTAVCSPGFSHRLSSLTICDYEKEDAILARRAMLDMRVVITVFVKHLTNLSLWRMVPDAHILLFVMHYPALTKLTLIGKHHGTTFTTKIRQFCSNLRDLVVVFDNSLPGESSRLSDRAVKAMLAELPYLRAIYTDDVHYIYERLQRYETRFRRIYSPASYASYLQ